jgi:hypothetical protein
MAEKGSRRNEDEDSFFCPRMQLEVFYSDQAQVAVHIKSWQGCAEGKFEANLFLP